MRRFSSFAIAMSLFFSWGALTAQAADLVNIPAGQIEAIWLSPVSIKDSNKKIEKIYVQVEKMKAMRFPVTVGEFKIFLKNKPEWSKQNISALYSDSYYLNEMDSQSDQTPMTFVSWFAAKAYCEDQGLRLPTVNEWEYMAAASETKADANREEKFLRRILNWYGEPRETKLKPVGRIYKNKYGLWDMHGLIWEWVDDFNSNFVTGESREDGNLNKDMFCGGGSMSSSDKENYAAFMRFAFRSGLKGTSSIWNLGFRCVQ